MALSLATLAVTLTAPIVEATHEYVLTRLGSFATGSPVKSVGISTDGQWAVAGSLGGAVRLFGLDAAPPFVPVWASPPINVTNKFSRGSSHSVAISADGRYISAGTGTTSECSDPAARGCLFLFERQGGGAPLWSRPLFMTAYTTDVTDDYVVAGSYPSVYTIDGSTYWDGPPGGLVDLSADGRYLASSSGLRVYVHEIVGTGFTPVWSFDVTPRAAVFAQALDLAEDGLSKRTPDGSEGA